MKNNLSEDFFDSTKQLIRKMRTTFLILVVFASSLFATDVSSQVAKVNISIKNASIIQVIRAIEDQTDYLFVYDKNEIDLTRQVDIVAENKSVADVLSGIFSNTNVVYAMEGSNIMLMGKSDAVQVQQQKSVSGKVTDSSGAPIPGVTVIVKGTKMGIITDTNGNYSLFNIPENATLQFSFVGLKTQEIAVQGKTTINVILAEETIGIEEVVAVGYGTQKKRDIIGSVTTIKMSEKDTRSLNTFDAALEGLAAGVSVQSQSGSPGAGSTIKIRGANSINLPSDPLWIIDGVPVFSNPSGLGSSNQNPMSLFNSNDIESIQVLKDAAAISIYGSRASNGVIIVTTKNGEKGVSSTSFNYSTGVSTLTRTPEDVGFSNTNKWFQIMDQTYQNSYGRNFTMNDYYRFAPQPTAQNYPQLTRDQAESTNTNWYNEIFHTGSYSEYNLSSTHSYDKGSFFISGNYRDENGVQMYTGLKRFSFRSNVKFNPSPNLTIGANVIFSSSTIDKRNSGITSLATYALPWFPVYVPGSPKLYFNAYTGSNPAALQDPANTLNNVKQFRGLGVFSLNYNIAFIKGLSFRTELSADVIQSNYVNWSSQDINLNGALQPTSRAMDETVTNNVYNYNFYGTYNKKSELNSFTMVAGVEGTRESQYYRSMNGEGLVGKYQEIGTPTVLTQMRGNEQGERYLLGYFGRADYKLKDKYLFGLSARQDGTSAFTSQHRWGTFYAASAGWIITQEQFASFLGPNTFLKLRGSYGETGNQNLPSGLDVTNYNGNATYGSINIQGVNGTNPINIATSNLHWESTKSFDIGADFGLMENRINGSLAYYHRLVYGMLLPAPLPASAGIGSQQANYGATTYDVTTNQIWSNIGNLVNSGFELELHTVNYNKNNLKWSTDFNISFNKNVIQSLTHEADATGKGIVTATTVSRQGHERAEWFLAEYAGVDRLTGIPMIYALDKSKYNKTGVTERMKDQTGKDSLIIATRTNIQGNQFYHDGKSADPKYYGGLSNTLQYKGFDFKLLIAFSGGNYILDYDRQMETVPSETRVSLKDLYDNSWKKIGDVSKYPQMRADGTYLVNGVPNADFGDSYVFYDREFYKGDYIRLKNIQLGYSFSAALLNKIGMKGLRIYASASNLFTWTKYPGFDPEGAGLVYYSADIPQLKSLIFGIDVKL